MRMRRTQHIGPRFMDRRMDHKRRSIEQLHRSTGDDLSLMVHLDQVRHLDQRERNAEGIHPERSGVDWVAESDVSSDAFVEAEFSEDAEGGCQAPFQIFPLLIFVLEFGRTGEFGHLHLGFLGVQARLQGRSDRGFG